MVILTSGLIVKIVMMKLFGNDGSDSANNDDGDDWNGDIERFQVSQQTSDSNIWTAVPSQ